MRAIRVEKERILQGEEKHVGLNICSLNNIRMSIKKILKVRARKDQDNRRGEKNR